MRIFLAFLISIFCQSIFAAEAASTKVGGFLDFQFRSITAEDNDPTFDINGDGIFDADEDLSGFQVRDGAVYITHSLSDTDLTIDLPFFWSDTDNNNFQIATSKAQAFLGLKLSDNFKLNLGQFDTPYGFDVNDSKDNYFSNQGLIYTYFVPVTHTGVMALYTMSGLTFKLLASNADNLGARRSKSNEYGLQAAWANDMFRLTVGGLTHKRIEGAKNLIDVMAGMTLGAWALDIEATQLQEPKPTGFTAEFDSGTAFLVQTTFKTCEKSSIGARYESVTTRPNFAGSVVSPESHTQFSVGGQWQWNEAVKLRLDYTAGQLQPLADDNTGTAALDESDKFDQEMLTLSSVYVF